MPEVVIHDETGILARVKDPNEPARALIELAENGEERQEKGKCGQNAGSGVLLCPAHG